MGPGRSHTNPGPREALARAPPGSHVDRPGARTRRAARGPGSSRPPPRRPPGPLPDDPSPMIRLSREADYALVLLAQIAGAEGGEHPSARSLSEATGLPQPMVGKVLKALTRGGLLESRRGAQGGYALAVPPERITIARLVQVLEGPIGLTDCSPGRGSSCDYEERCPVRGPVARLNAVIRQALEDVSLSQIVSGRATRARSDERSEAARAS